MGFAALLFPCDVEPLFSRINFFIAIRSLTNSLLHISNDIPFCDVGLSGLFSRASDVKAFMCSERKHSVNQ